jgi:Rad3-related DNA helicase
MPGGYILVVQKVLQDQMARDLDKLGSGNFPAALLKGSAEYPCPKFKNCGNAIKGCSCKRAGTCPYREAKKAFCSSTIGITNYAYYLTDAIYQPEPLATRALLALDEAHNLAKTLRGLVGLTMDQASLMERDQELAQDLPKVGNRLSDLLLWLQEKYLPLTYERVQVLVEFSQDQDATAKDVRLATEAKMEYLRARSVAEDLAADTSGWVYWKDKSRDDNLSLRCSPLDAGPYLERYLGDFPRRVYLSAYVGRSDVFCREIGLDPDAVAVHRCGSTFPPENRPIHLLNAGSMGQASINTTQPTVLKLLAMIAKKHLDRGIVHAHSYVLADAAYWALQNAGLGARLFYPRKADEREEALKQHAATPGAILISPSVYEGFDFAEDKCRWQVIIKAPFQSLGDKVVSTLAQRDPEWYQMETLKSFLQACGRAVRSDSDQAVTFVLDSDLGRLIREHKRDLPAWFYAAIHDV